MIYDCNKCPFGVLLSSWSSPTSSLLRSFFFLLLHWFSPPMGIVNVSSHLIRKALMTGWMTGWCPSDWRREAVLPGNVTVLQKTSLAEWISVTLRVKQAVTTLLWLALTASHCSCHGCLPGWVSDSRNYWTTHRLPDWHCSYWGFFFYSLTVCVPSFDSLCSFVFRNMKSKKCDLYVIVWVLGRNVHLNSINQIYWAAELRF